MGFWEHLEELRWRLIKAVIGVVLGGIIAAIFIDYIMNDFLLA
ncbi:MAG TPA: twin-arginine translocase subunit TatC, partial [Ignavibacteria bacterium]|nr:twin-arginine translocase subunit TatC [Ignavibacteria bacterium]